MLVSVFTQNDGREFSYVNNPSEEAFMVIERKFAHSDSYEVVGKVYVSKIFVVDFAERSVMIRVSNHHGENLAVEIDLEGND